jgi:hypothetical protein
VGTLGEQIVTAVVAGLCIQRREEHLFTDHDDPRCPHLALRLAVGWGQMFR